MKQYSEKKEGKSKKKKKKLLLSLIQKNTNTELISPKDKQKDKM